MKKLLALASAAVALALVGCGADGSSCETETATVQATNAGCTFAPGTTVTVQLRPACQHCYETSPSCEVEFLGNDIELSPVYRQCSEDRSCPDVSCGFTPIQCVFTTPNASAQYRFAFPVEPLGSIDYRPVTVAPGGSSTCQL
jgi:hypothetical protein